MFLYAKERLLFRSKIYEGVGKLFFGALEISNGPMKR